MNRIEKKTYLRKYYLDSDDKSNFIGIKWQTGLKEFYLYYKSEEIERIDNFEKMSKGVKVNVPEVGYVFF